jgi:FkbM family methyltransferase
MAFVMHFLRPEETFCDVGANIGAFSVLASGVTGAKSIAFEPSPETFEMLQCNIRLNNLTSRVRTMQAVVGGQIGTAQFSSGLGTENYVTKSAGEKTVAVPMTTLDHELATTPATVLKVDVEGFETEVFSGGKQTLQNPALLALIVERNGSGNRYGYDEAALHTEIRSCGFKPHSYAPFTRTLHPIGDNDVGNIIYIRDFTTVYERLRSAPSFQIGSLKV